MKIFCIADTAEVEIGLKLAGCDGVYVVDKQEVDKKIDEVLENKEIGVLILTKKIYELSKERIDYIRLNKRFPLVTII